MTLWSLVKEHFRQLTNNSYSPLEWTMMRVCTFVFWAYHPIHIFLRFDSQPFPEGICKLINCAGFHQSPLIYIVITLVGVLGILYLTNRKMLLATFGLFLISLIAITLERSNSLWHRREMLTLIFFAQFLAYLLPVLKARGVSLFYLDRSVQHNAIQFSIQVFVAGYMVSAITKLQNSGIEWIMDAPNMAVLLIKAGYYHAYDAGQLHLINQGLAYADFTINHPNLIRILFAGALLLEMFSFFAAFGKRWALYYGLLLLLFHVMVELSTSILIMSFVTMLLIYCINLPWILASPVIITWRWLKQGKVKP